MVSVYNNQIDDQQNTFKADQFHYEKSMIKYWDALQEGVKTSKKEAV